MWRKEWSLGHPNKDNIELWAHKKSLNPFWVSAACAQLRLMVAGTGCHSLILPSLGRIDIIFMQEQTENYPVPTRQMLQGRCMALSSFAARKPKQTSYFGPSLHIQGLALWPSTCNKAYLQFWKQPGTSYSFWATCPGLVLSVLPRSPTQAQQLLHPHVPSPHS